MPWTTSPRYCCRLRSPWVPGTAVLRRGCPRRNTPSPLSTAAPRLPSSISWVLPMASCPASQARDSRAGSWTTALRCLTPLSWRHRIIPLPPGSVSCTPSPLWPTAPPSSPCGWAAAVSSPPRPTPSRQQIRTTHTASAIGWMKRARSLPPVPPMWTRATSPTPLCSPRPPIPAAEGQAAVAAVAAAELRRSRPPAATSPASRPTPPSPA